MINQVLPERIDNTYRGHKLALWFLAVVVFIKTLQGLFVISSGYSIVRDADGIPLDTFSVTSAQTVVAMFAISGFSRLLVSLLCVLSLVRYRSAITFMFTLLALDYLGRQLIFHFYPLVRTGTPVGPMMNHFLFALTVVGLVLSLSSKRNLDAQK